MADLETALGRKLETTELKLGEHFQTVVETVQEDIKDQFQKMQQAMVSSNLTATDGECWYCYKIFHGRESINQFPSQTLLISNIQNSHPDLLFLIEWFQPRPYNVSYVDDNAPFYKKVIPLFWIETSQVVNEKQARLFRSEV